MIELVYRKPGPGEGIANMIGTGNGDQVDSEVRLVTPGGETWRVGREGEAKDSRLDEAELAAGQEGREEREGEGRKMRRGKC